MTESDTTAPSSGRDWRTWALGLLRYVAAWLLACVAATLALFAIAIAGDVVQYGPQMIDSLSQNAVWMIVVGAFIVMFTAPVWPILVAFARATRSPRGWTDAGLGAAMGMVDVFLFSNGGARLSNLVVFGLAGAVAGAVFWLAAGRPRPPYRYTLRPGRRETALS